MRSHWVMEAMPTPSYAKATEGMLGLVCQP